jgi:hypothetical protein
VYFGVGAWNDPQTRNSGWDALVITGAASRVVSSLRLGYPHRTTSISLAARPIFWLVLSRETLRKHGLPRLLPAYSRDGRRIASEPIYVQAAPRKHLEGKGKK